MTEQRYRSVRDFPEPRSPWYVEFEWQVVGGQMECVGFALKAKTKNPRPITAQLLRSVPFARLADEERERRLRRYRGQVGDDTTIADMRRRWRELVGEGADDPDAPGGERTLGAIAEQALRAWEASSTGRGRPRVYGPDHFAAVAQVYAEAYAAGQHPTRAVADEFTVSRSTAAKWVARARSEFGLLGQTEPRQAGGVNPRKRGRRKR